jgi:hypothetical protein
MKQCRFDMVTDSPDKISPHCGYLRHPNRGLSGHAGGCVHRPIYKSTRLAAKGPSAPFRSGYNDIEENGSLSGGILFDNEDESSYLARGIGREAAARGIREVPRDSRAGRRVIRHFLVLPLRLAPVEVLVQIYGLIARIFVRASDFQAASIAARYLTALPWRRAGVVRA